MRSRIPPEPEGRTDTMEPFASNPLGATALFAGPKDYHMQTHIERINPSWGTNGGWVPGTGIPH